MPYADVFVGLVSFVLGGLLIIAAAVNWEPFYRLSSAARLSALLGRTAARRIHGVAGILLASLGAAMILGLWL
jgi:small neutral amino acid transporter SnatA (MarC family)